MNYELAKELKEAGFPQNDKHFYWSERTEPPTWWCVNAMENRDPTCAELPPDCASPTLSELISALGADFGCLEQTPFGDFIARSPENFEGDESKPWGRATTPEESTAKLWLTTHKNNA